MHNLKSHLDLSNHAIKSSSRQQKKVSAHFVLTSVRWVQVIRFLYVLVDVASVGNQRIASALLSPVREFIHTLYREYLQTACVYDEFQ